MPTRRSAIKNTAAALATGAAFSLSGCRDNNRLRQWDGMAMGAPASIKFRAPLNIDAKNLIPAATGLAGYIEKIASLYIENSSISHLNKYGSIYPAPEPLVRMINAAREVSEATNGAFDISVQPLWELANTLAVKKISPEQSEKLWAEARAKVDYRGVEIDGATVRFAKPGMKISLNGIAQGYITEQVSTLLKERGVEHALVNFGEYKAFGENINGKPWRVGIQNPVNIMDTAEIIDLRDQAIATSAASAGQVSDQISHIFDARTGRDIGTKPAFASASVLHPSATMADAYATAFTLMDEADIRNIVKSQPGMRAILIKQDGETIKT